MTQQRRLDRNALASHLKIERFQVYAAKELAAAPYFEKGVCFQPECGRKFNPTVAWQKFCSDRCSEKATFELRRIGLGVALPLLIHRTGKYEKDDEAVRDLNRTARRYVSHVQTEWVNDRAQRAKVAANKLEGGA